MAKLMQKMTIALVVCAAICSASPAKQRTSNSKFLARQEVSEDVPAQTPYPPAGIKPEVRFDLPTDQKLIAPDNTYLPPVGEPAKAYGPPAKTYGPPAKTYGPPEAGVKGEVEEVSSSEVVKSVDAQPEPEETQTNEVQSEQQPEEAQSLQQSGEENDAAEENITEAVPRTEDEQIEAEIAQVEDEEGLVNPLSERIVLLKSNGQKTAKLRSAKLQVAEPVYFFNYNGQLYRLLN